MPKLKYKNISKEEQNVIGVGLVKPGDIIEVEEPIENPNFELQQEGRRTGVDPVTRKPKR